MPENNEPQPQIEWPEQPELPEDTPLEAQRKLAYLCRLHPDAHIALIREKFNEDLVRELLYENGFDINNPTTAQIAFCIRQIKNTERMFPKESK